MAKRRPVTERLRSLEPVPRSRNFSLAAVRNMYEAFGGSAVECRIVAHARTRIFDLPGIDLRADRDEPHQDVFSSAGMHACVASNLVDYFESGAHGTHYAISPSLRHDIQETEERVRSQKKESTPLFLVVEQWGPLSPVDMLSGECCLADEVVERDGELEPLLIGGRQGQQFLMAWATLDGVWPAVPSNRASVNMILAGVRAAQQTADPIGKHLDQAGFVTDAGEFVLPMHPTATGRGSTATPMDSETLEQRVSEIRAGIAAMAKDIDTPRLALLVNSMYREDQEDDAYQRLHYLQLWQSLMEAGKRVLGYQGGSIKHDDEVVSGQSTLRELTEYRHDIAHGWTDVIDENELADLQHTVNQLIRDKYF